jgi:Leu/Phe-tRNA-protein transferase
MNKGIRFIPGIGAFISPEDVIDDFLDALIAIDYREEFCVSTSFSPQFIARLMEAGFLVMAQDNILLPKIHVERSVLFFEDIHIKKSIRHLLPRYELRYDTDFDHIVDQCIAFHGEGWLVPNLVRGIRQIRRLKRTKIRPVSFGVYRDGVLRAGEFGIAVGGVYTSYSGYTAENNAGTVQLILMTEFLRDNGFSFLDLGMPMDYKSDLGAHIVDTQTFVSLFRRARN